MRKLFLALLILFFMTSLPLFAAASTQPVSVHHPVLLAAGCVDETGAVVDCNDPSAIPDSGGTVIPSPGGGTNIPPAGGGSFNPFRQDSGITSLCGLVNKILDIITQIGAIIAVVFIIWSGFLFVTAQGNPEKIKQAKRAFYTTIIGTAIVLGASVMTKIIINTVGSVTTAISGSSSANICASPTT